MENLLNKKVELLPVQLREGYTHCDICSGISWLLHKDNYIIPCMCVNGLVKVCSECNKPMGYNSYSCRNSDCKDKLEQVKENNRINMAIQLSSDDEKVKQSKMLYSYAYDGNSEGYFLSVDDYLDSLADNDMALSDNNNILWLCEENKFDIDVDSVLENELEEHYEDAYHNLSDVEELREYISKWCEKQNISSYYNGNKYYIRVTVENND